MRQVSGFDRRVGRLLGLIAGLAAVGSGCAPPWYYHFQEAETQARSLEQPMVVFYKDSFDVRSSRMEDVLKSGPVAPLLNGKVRCVLTSEFEPSRRYVAQYGVLQPPALILMHPDGTYHAHNGPMAADEIRTFFAESQPPGAQPNISPQIARQINYYWEGDYEKALQRAQRQNRELLIVYKWWLSGDSTDLIAVFESREEVARHFTETVNCLLDRDYAPNRDFVRRYGVTDVPGVILVHRDGTYHAHTGPMTAEQIVRFVTAARRTGASATPRRPPAAPTRAQTNPAAPGGATTYSWHSDFVRARAHARSRGADLFVFFTALYSETSARMARLLEQPEVARQFAGTVNCQLDFSNPANRQLMAAYGVQRAPAFVMIRPDDTYHALTGVVTAQNLTELVEAARQPGLSPRPATALP